MPAEAPAFRTGTSLVLVDVSVLDPRDRPVTNLSQNQFHVLDNGSEQSIRFFAREDAPVSLAVILDTSGSMAGKWDRARAEFTGGRAFAIDDRRRIADAAASMAREIHDQYVIGYQPPAPADDGKSKYHRIIVKVHREPSQPRLSLFHRSGYRTD